VSERYQYVSDGTPGQQRIISRQGRNATWQETYYDGMGRTIQVHQKADNGQEIRTTQEYDAFGRIIKSWIPYYGTHGEDGGYGTWGYVPADKSLSHTSNSYTAPEERVRTPDGYVTTTYAAGRRIITIDANGHRRDSILDALGRTIKVEEYNADPTTYEAEATGYHQTGSSNGSAWVSPAVGSGAAYLTYGPYAAPQAVGYKQAVRFRLAIDSISGNNDQIARIDVWDATAGQTLAERYLYRKDFEGGLDNFSEFVLVFDTTNRSGHSLEYRVYWQNKARMAHDRTVVSWRQASRVTQYTYDTLDHLTGIIDAGSNTTSIGYDGLGRKIQMTDPDMGRWSYDYDPRGNLAMQSDARACVIDFQYDAANRLTLKNYNTSASTCPASDPGNVNYTYDAYTSGTNYGRGHRTGMQDASGSTSWRYDVRGRMTRESKVISGQTFNTYHTYNAMDQVVTTTYPDGEAVTTGYNDAARPNTINGAVSYVSSASYSAAGQLTQQTFGNNVTTAYAYNPFSSRLTNIQTSDLLSFAYAYDKVGNLVHIDDHQDIQFSDSFDTKNTAAWVWNSYQTVPYTDGDGKVVHNDGTGSSYSANFYRNSHNLSHGEGLQVRFKVDRSDTAAHFSVESNNGTYRRFGVIANNGKVYVQYNNGGSWTYPKDLINPLKVDTWYVLQIRVNDSQGFTVEVYEENDPTQRGSYTRSMTGGLSWRFRHWIYQGSAYLDAYTEWSTTQRGTFIYDALDRLDEASVSGGGSGLYIRDYSYDAIGNLTYKTDTGGYNYTTSLGLSGCTAGTPATKPHAARSASAFGSFGYDCNGNMTSRTIGGTTRSLTYNADNLLHQIKQGSTVLATYTYDGDGTLVKKVAGGQTTVYVGPHYEKNLSTGEVTKYYSLDGQRVAMREGSTLTYLHSDHLGSASLATNSSGGMISEMRYYPYGATRWTYGTMPTDRRFTGQREETGFGLYDYVARRYDPVLGRFIQADSVVPEPGNPQSLNRYTYVLGNPLRYTDPTGHWYYDPGADALVHTREKHNEHPEYFELAKLRLYNYGKMLRRNPNLNAFDRFVALMDYAGASYDFTSQGTVDQYIVDITAVVHGYDYNDGAGWFFTGHGSNWSPFWLGNGAFEDEFHGVGVTTDDADLGWHADYRDGTGNQAYHFWFYAAVAYHDGGAVAFAGNFIHDGNQTWLGGRLSQPYTEYLYPRLPTYLSMEVGNKADYHLGVQGVYLGSQLRMFRDAGLGVHPAQVGAWLRMNLGE
jgi:RHS repeat-associated protein